jgi:hypothetical protein
VGRRYKTTTVYFFSNHLAWIKKDDRQRLYASGDIFDAYYLAADYKILYACKRSLTRKGPAKFKFLWCLKADDIIEYMDEWMHDNHRTSRRQFGMVGMQPNVRQSARRKLTSLVNRKRQSNEQNAA